MSDGNIVAPVPASDVKDEDPFTDGLNMAEEPGDPFAPPATPNTLPGAGDAWATAFRTTPTGEVLAPFVPSSAYDPMPPKVNGQELGAARMAQFMLQRELERASKPMLDVLGPSIETLSRFGYDRPIEDGGTGELQRLVQRAVRKL